MTGRPSGYSEEIALEICDRMVTGESLRSICRDDNMPSKSTVLLWVARNREGFSDRYAKAFEARMIGHADELLDLADDSVNDYMDREDGTQCVNREAIARSRLRIDTRKWLLCKLIPRYADNQDGNQGADPAEALRMLAEKLPD